MTDTSKCPFCGDEVLTEHLPQGIAITESITCLNEKCRFSEDSLFWNQIHEWKRKAAKWDALQLELAMQEGAGGSVLESALTMEDDK